ncbi:MAG: rhomboid family intramembrane serine protease [Bacteroidales bacterium]|nr:rhomboid family intramembrane serine protease [Bacteroidales bacterium]
MFRYKFLTPIIFVLFLWLIKAIEIYFGVSYYYLGILPLHYSGLKGIVFAPLIHSSLNHIYSNSIPLLLNLLILNYFINNGKTIVLLLLYFIPGILLWFIGRNSFHIGASGFVYALSSFFLFIGIFKANKNLLALSLFVIFFYNGLVLGVFPNNEKVSWESHFSGIITGLLVAYLFRKFDFSVETKQKNPDKIVPYSTTFGDISFIYEKEEAKN